MQLTHKIKSSFITYLGMAAIITGCAISNNNKGNAEGAKMTADAESATTLKTAMDFMGAMNGGDMDTMTSLMHEDMVWQNSGDKTMPWIGPWNGKQAILDNLLPKFGENFTTVKWASDSSFASGDTAAFFGTMVGKLNKTGIETPEFPWALQVKVKDGQVILWNWFEDSFAVSKAFHGN